VLHTLYTILVNYSTQKFTFSIIFLIFLLIKESELIVSIAEKSKMQIHENLNGTTDNLSKKYHNPKSIFHVSTCRIKNPELRTSWKTDSPIRHRAARVPTRTLLAYVLCTRVKSRSLLVESIKSSKAERAYRARPVVGATKRTTWFVRDVSRRVARAKSTAHRREYSLG